MTTRAFLASLLAFGLTVGFVSTHAAENRPLTPADIDDIAVLLKLEDTRQFDEAALTRLVKSAHPEVRRRAVQAVGRIANPRGRALLVAARADADVEVVATVAFAAGQLKDPDAVPWLSDLLSSTKTPPGVGREAAQALGKIRTPESRTALHKYLSGAPATAPALVVGEALLSSGRFTTPGDLAPIVRWMTSPDVEVRWRAAWALFRLRDPAAAPHLLRLTGDRSADVRVWAVRGLTPIAPAQGGRGGAAAQGGAAATQAPPASAVAIPGVDRAKLAARLRDAVRDPDRRVRTEALRALGQYDDDASFEVVLASLDSVDTWLSVSAAEAMGRFQARAAAVVPKLTDAAGPGRPTALRVTALTPLVTLAPDAALDVASALARERSLVARNAAVQALQRLGAAGKARLDALSADPAVRDLLPQAGVPSARAAQAQPAAPARPDADYRRLVERWVVPDYNGAARPRAIWETPKGTIELELCAGDAPLAMEYFVRAVESGEIVGTEFGRVVPNFVAQQRTIRDAPRLRDEVNRRGLTRANLSWASSGLDTGRPGYTLGSTPQPHNEGDFTALGRVVAGMNVVDRLELGDAVTAARMKR
jgi:peptidylprolyl isomerase